MKASERLINTKFPLKVFKLHNKNGKPIGVCFYNCEIKNGYFLISDFGTGFSFEEACENYLELIQGKTLVFDAYRNRKEVVLI